ncbi:MAG TPA: hypothetical protein VKB52_16615 [Rhodanobacteraceae bacterium]|nr:hypothetical protein [Rhodanobacteraceae bacterium]
MSRSRTTRALLLAALLGAASAGAQSALTGVTRMAGGYQHECAVRDTGEVDCWGLNHDGELGDGTLVDRALPSRVAVDGGIAIDIAAGLYHTCIIDGAGGVQCWGENYVGQVGNGTTSFAETSPRRVIGLDAGVSVIGTGADHSCAVLGGAAKCWGANNKGQLGTGVAGDPIATPQDVQGLAGTVTDISGGYDATCAVVDGAAKCWGSNTYGTLGNGTNDDSLVPVGVVGLDHGVTRIALAGETACALVDGGVKCWGDGIYGQLGNGWYAPSNTPVDVVGLSERVVDVAVSWYGACATTGDAMYCWGSAPLGNFGPLDWALEPVLVAFDGGDIAAMGLGSTQSCAAQGGIAYCWGDNLAGQLGAGPPGHDSLTPVAIPELAVSIDAIEVGNANGCARSAGALSCWGDNSYGQLGDGTYISRGSPVPLATPGVVDAVSLNGAHTCAVVDGGAVCWGANDWGELGDGTFATRPTPFGVSGLSSGVSAVGVGTTHSCAIAGAGAVKCWGDGSYGMLGNNDTWPQPLPVDVIGLDAGASALALGYAHTCAIVDGGAKCWGGAGATGTGSTDDYVWTPTDVVGLTSGVTAISAHGNTTCAIANGGATCWGQGDGGQLGDGTLHNSNVPVAVLGLDSGVLAIDVSRDHVCALTTSGMKCWGGNAFGQLGNGETSHDPVAAPIDATLVPADASGLGVGTYFSCFVREGAVSCWGNNQQGALGTGGIPSWPVPLQVHDVDGLFRSGFDG